MKFPPMCKQAQKAFLYDFKIKQNGHSVVDSQRWYTADYIFLLVIFKYFNIPINKQKILKIRKKYFQASHWDR